MWYFQSVVDDNRQFLIIPGKEFVIGRRDCDIVIENDQSVSRKHAILTVTHPEANVANVNKPPSLILKDVSRFGTFVNNHKITGQKLLGDGDKVRFGSPQSAHTYRVVYEPFVVTTSCLDAAGKKEVRSLLCQIGGHISNQWRQDCRFLVMKTITVTIKVVCALVSQKPIITVDFLRDLLKHYKGEMTEKPQPEKYLPTVTERLIEPGVSFQTDAKRSSIFLGMSFYFLNDKQFQKINLAVELGGGIPILCDSPESTDLEAFLEDNTVVMNPAPGEVVDKGQKEWVEKVKRFLTKKGKVMVQDAEVGYAVLYVSTDNYCNPDKDVTHLLPGAGLPSQSLTQTNLASQLVSSQTDAGQPRAAFKKPAAAPASVREISAASRVSGSSGKGTTKSQDSKPTLDELDQKENKVFTVPESMDSKPNLDEVEQKELKVFTVPESLTQYSVKVKSEKRHEEHESEKSGVNPVYTSNRDVSQSASKPHRSEKPVAIKAEVDDKADSVQHRPSGSTCSSATLFDSDVMSAPKVKEEVLAKRKKPVCLLDEEEDDIVQTRKPPPSKTKRRLQDISDDDDDDPFSHIKKRISKAAPPPPKSPQGTECETQPKANSPTPKLKQKPTSARSKLQEKAASPEPKIMECDSSDEQDPDPFDFVINHEPSREPASRRGKRAQRSPSAEPPSKKERLTRRSPSPKPASRLGSASAGGDNEESAREMTTDSRQETVPGRRSPSPKPKSKIGSTTRKEVCEEPALELVPDSAETRSSSPKPSRPPVAQNGQDKHERSSSDSVPEGFLTTRKPITDQIKMKPNLGEDCFGASAVMVDPNFDTENILAPSVVVHFEDLVVRQNRPQAAREEQSDVPHGMMRWKGKIVPNFKKFTKVKHAGADRLPKIIGGRDLQVHCGTTNKMMEDWLKDLQEAESEQQEREREMENLFDWQPPSMKGKKNRR